MPRIYRTLGAGEHSLAEAVLVFDDMGIAESEDEAVLATVEQFPQMFLVLGAEDPVPGTPPEPWEDPDAPCMEQPDGGVGEEEPPPEPEVDPESAVDEPRTESALEMLTVVELRELAGRHNIPRIAGMNKAELIAAVLAAQG